MNRNIKHFLLTTGFIAINCVVAIILSKVLHTPIDGVVAWMALGSCCGIYADQLLNR